MDGSLSPSSKQALHQPRAVADSILLLDIILPHNAQKHPLERRAANRVVLQAQGLLVALEQVDDTRDGPLPLVVDAGDGEADLAAEHVALEPGAGDVLVDPGADALHLLGGRAGGRGEQEADVIVVAVLVTEGLCGADGEDALGDDGGAGGERVGFFHAVCLDEEVSACNAAQQDVRRLTVRRRERLGVIFWMIFQKARFATASMADVGSSRTRTGGVPIRAMARLSFLLFPPESFDAKVDAWGVRLSLAMTWSTLPLTSSMPLTRA